MVQEEEATDLSKVSWAHRGDGGADGETKQSM